MKAYQQINATLPLPKLAELLQMAAINQGHAEGVDSVKKLLDSLTAEAFIEREDARALYLRDLGDKVALLLTKANNYYKDVSRPVELEVVERFDELQKNINLLSNNHLKAVWRINEDQ